MAYDVKAAYEKKKKEAVSGAGYTAGAKKYNVEASYISAKKEEASASSLPTGEKKQSVVQGKPKVTPNNAADILKQTVTKDFEASRRISASPASLDAIQRQQIMDEAVRQLKIRQGLDTAAKIAVDNSQKTTQPQVVADQQRKAAAVPYQTALKSYADSVKRAYAADPNDNTKTDAKQVPLYLASELGTGFMSTLGGIYSGAAQTVGDLASGGKYSEITKYFADNPADRQALEIAYKSSPKDGGHIYDVILGKVAAATGATKEMVHQARRSFETDDLAQEARDSFDVSSGFKNTAGNVAFMVGQQIPAMLLTAGGSGAAFEAAISQGIMAGSAYGQKLKENSKKYGFDMGSYASAVAAGAIEALTENLDNFTPTMNSILKIATLGDLAKTAIGEGLEEAVGYPIENIIDWLVLDGATNREGFGDPKKFSEIFDMGEWTRNFIDGTVVGGLIGAGGVIANIAGQRMNGTISAQEAVEKVANAIRKNGIELQTPDVNTATDAEADQFVREAASALVVQAEEVKAQAAQQEQQGVPEQANNLAAQNEVAAQAQQTAGAQPKKGAEVATEMGLGKHGAEAAEKAGITPENVGAFTAYYEAGKDGKAFEEVKTVQTGIDENVARQAYNAGQMDAIDNAAQTADNGVEQEAIANEEQRERDGLRLRGSREWPDGQNPGGQPGGMVESAGRNQSGNEAAGSATGAGNQRVYRAYQKSTTGALGIAGGSAKDTVYTVGADYSKETAQAKKLAGERGLRVIFFTGNNLTIKGKQVRGYVSKDRVFVRADHPKYTPEQIMRHELGHDKISLGEINVDEVLEQLDSIGMLEDATRISDAYAAAYETVGQKMTIDEIFEEMVCDALADMNDLTLDERSAATMAKVKEATQSNYKKRTANAPKTTEQAARKLERKVGKELDVPAAKQKEKLRSIVETMAEQALSGGEISQDIRDELFETAYENGVKTDDEFYWEAKEVKEYLRSQAIKINEYDKHDIPDWNDFRKSCWGLLRISNKGLPVDVAYQEVQEMAPYLFPKDITSASDQLMHMRDVADRIRKTDKSLDEYYGSDAEAFKESARVAFDRDVDQFLNDLRKLQRKRSDDGKASTDFSANSQINESMTMQQAKQMIQRAFVLGGIQGWYDGEYKNGDEWLRGEGVEDVAMIIDNEYSLQSAYLDKIPGILNGDFYTEDVLQAYLDGTLTGKVAKKNTEKIDLARSLAVADERFYAPKKIENAKALYETALQRVTKANEQEVIRARAKVLLYAHNKGAAETLGLTESELNKKLRSWSNYSAKARDISQRINSGVQASNRWTGIENMSYVTRAQVSPDEVARMVKSVEGKGGAFQNNYIARTMMALDTHIDWSWLTFKFDTYAGVNEKQATKCNGYYLNSQRLIHVKMDAPNTVAHEMGHALDYQWARDLGLGGALTEAYRNTERVSGDAKIFFDHFMEFTDSLIESSDIRSAYSGDVKETFARFVDKFVAWTEQLATGRNATYNTSFYNDKFTGAQFVQFARLLQEKAALDAASLAAETAAEEKTNKESLELSEEAVQAAMNKLIEKYGAIEPGENPFREVQMPKKTGENENVSKTVRTILEAKATPEAAIPTIEQMVANGDFSYETITDKQAIADAQGKLTTKGWSKTLSKWLDEAKNGTVSKDHTATGWSLYNNAANAGDLDTAMTILEKMVLSQRNAAQALQATRVLKKLSPEAQLYAAQRSVEDLQEELNERYGGKKITPDSREKEVEAAETSRRDTADSLASAYKSYKRGKRNSKGNVGASSHSVGEPFVFEYAQKVGEAVARGLEVKEKKEKTYLQQIVSEIKRFASEKIDSPQEKKKASTATDLLRDYVQNREFFQNAWEAAQNEIRAKHGNDPMFLEFIGSGIGVDAAFNPKNAIFVRALVSAAADSGETAAMISRQMALGITNIGENIANRLIEQTGATGEMAETIRDAAFSYVDNIQRTYSADQSKLLDSAIRSAMRDIGVTMTDVIYSNRDSRLSVAQAVADKLAAKYGFGSADASRVGRIVADQFSEMVKNSARSKLESVFRERNKSRRKTVEQQMRELGNLGAFDADSEFNEAATKRILQTDHSISLKIDPELARQFLAAKTQSDRDAIMAEIYKDVGKQMPSTFRDKWNAWRYLAMLGNPRTHVRNILGNAGFVPVVAAKNLTATAIEKAVNAVTGGKTGRSKAVIGTSAKDKALLSAAWADYDNVQGDIMAGGKYSDFQIARQNIEEGRRIFKNRVLEAARRGNSRAMEAEDAWFSKPHYAYALAGYCKANGITPEMITDGKAIQTARAYAIREAQKATYRDTNAFSQTISDLGKVNKTEKNGFKNGMGVVLQGILPFRKTPANILVRGVEYSPIGLVKTIALDSAKVKRGDMTATEMIDNLSAGLTGTGLLALGAFLAAQGLIRGHGPDDDKKEFEELQGHQAYSLEVGGTSITLDWLAPECLPFFVGVNLYEQARATGEELTMSTILSAITNVSEPMLEMSCMQSLNDVFDAVGYASSNDLSAISSILASAATSYLTQALPTIFGQAERTGQDVRYTTYTTKDAFLTRDMQYAIGSASARIPGWDYNQIPYIDAWGRREDTGGLAARAFGNFANPSYTSNITGSEMEDELMRVYDETGDASVFPTRAQRSFPVDGEQHYLSADEYVRYATTKGETSYNLVSDLVEMRIYDRMSEEDKVDAISDAYSLANVVAKYEVSDYETTGWMAKAVAAKKIGIDYSKYLEVRLTVKDIESIKDADGDSVSNSKGLLVMEAIYKIPGLNDKQRRQLFEDFNVGKSIIDLNKAAVEAKLKNMR